MQRRVRTNSIVAWVVKKLGRIACSSHLDMLAQRWQLFFCPPTPFYNPIAPLLLADTWRALRQSGRLGSTEPAFDEGLGHIWTFLGAGARLVDVCVRAKAQRVRCAATRRPVRTNRTGNIDDLAPMSTEATRRGPLAMSAAGRSMDGARSKGRALGFRVVVAAGCLRSARGPGADAETTGRRRLIGRASVFRSRRHRLRPRRPQRPRWCPDTHLVVSCGVSKRRRRSRPMRGWTRSRANWCGVVLRPTSAAQHLRWSCPRRPEDAEGSGWVGRRKTSRSSIPPRSPIPPKVGVQAASEHHGTIDIVARSARATSTSIGA